MGLVLTVAAVLQGPQSSQASPFGFVQFVHAANVNEVNILIEDVPVITGMNYLTATERIPVLHGVYTFTAFDPDTDERPARYDLSVVTGNHYVIVVVGTPGNLEIIVRSKVRVKAARSVIDYFGVNAALDAGNIDIRLLNPRRNNEVAELVYNNLPFARFGGYRGLPLGSHTLEVTSSDNTHLIGQFHFQVSGYSGQVLLIVAAGRGTTPEEGFVLIGFDTLGQLIPATVVTHTADRGTRPEFMLNAPWPNPTDGAAQVTYSLSEPDRVRLEVYDLLNRHIVTLQDGQLRPGVHNAQWDGRTVHGSWASPGVYVWRLQAGQRRFYRRSVVIR